MHGNTSRREFLYGLAAAGAVAGTRLLAEAGAPTRRPERPRGHPRQAYALPPEFAAYAALSVVLGRITDRAVVVSALSRRSVTAYLEYGTVDAPYTHRTAAVNWPADEPVETPLTALEPDRAYVYRVRIQGPNDGSFQPGPERRFHTQRAPGQPFTFAIQGDSHPERPQMSHPELYARTLASAAAAQPDFYFCMGDDFSVAPVRSVTPATVAERYTLQRPFLGLVAHSAPLFLLNGNHEQASRFNFNQTDIRHDVAVFAQQARNRYYPLPAPDGFYGGDGDSLPSIGPLRDYYAWTWGDALFVVLDNYWHAPALVDSGYGEGERGGAKRDGGRRDRDGWDLTLGEAQYRWFRQTLAASAAKFKFVFAHHVLGTGRGGVDECDLFEWGGRNRRGEWEFAQRRPGWELPIHPLMVRHGVTIFFQGHDHLFARQERDGVVYQEVPMPADHGYATYNADRYATGVKLPNSGYLRVSVSPENAKVEYVRSYLPVDETPPRRTGEVAHTYTVKPWGVHA